MVTIPAKKMDRAMVQTFMFRHYFRGEDARHNWLASTIFLIGKLEGVNSHFWYTDTRRECAP